MTDQWQQLKETITEMRDNDGTGTQQEVCKFLANLMDILEKQMSNEKNQNKGEWIYQQGIVPYKWRCNKCEKMFKTDFNYCPNCGVRMKGSE